MSRTLDLEVTGRQLDCQVVKKHPRNDCRYSFILTTFTKKAERKVDYVVVLVRLLSAFLLRGVLEDAVVKHTLSHYQLGRQTLRIDFRVLFNLLENLLSVVYSKIKKRRKILRKLCWVVILGPNPGDDPLCHLFEGLMGKNRVDELLVVKNLRVIAIHVVHEAAERG